MKKVILCKCCGNPIRWIGDDREVVLTCDPQGNSYYKIMSYFRKCKNYTYCNENGYKTNLPQCRLNNPHTKAIKDAFMKAIKQDITKICKEKGRCVVFTNSIMDVEAVEFVNAEMQLPITVFNKQDRPPYEELDRINGLVFIHELEPYWYHHNKMMKIFLQFLFLVYIAIIMTVIMVDKL